MRLSRNRCGCDCLNDVEPYPVNQDCYPEVSAEVSCCEGTPLGPVMTVLFAGDATVYEITRSTTETGVWEVLAVDMGAGVSMDLTLTCDGSEWSLRRVLSNATGITSDVTYAAETVHCGTGQTVETLIFPPELSETDETDPFEIVFAAPAGSGAPASATVSMLAESPTVEPDNWVDEHTCCTACPEGSPTHYLVDFGCLVRAISPTVEGLTPQIVGIAPPIMRLTRDCLFGDDACHWTGRMEDPGFWSYAVGEAWDSGGKTPSIRELIPIDTAIQGCECDNDTGFDSYPNVTDIAIGFEKWLPYNHSFAANLNWQCSSCEAKSVLVTGGAITATGGVHSHGECEILRILGSGEPTDGNFQLPPLYWDLWVDGTRSTLTFTGDGITIVYTTDEAWKCFGRNTMSLTSVDNPVGLKATPPSKICVVPARTSRPANPCETKEQQCACCDPGWDFFANLAFDCGGTLVKLTEVLTRAPLTTLADGSAVTAPCDGFTKSFTGECDDGAGGTEQVDLVIYIWCDGTTWYVAQCCKIGAGAWTCSTAAAGFECLCSVASISFALSGSCCCLFEEPEPPLDCTCVPPDTLYADFTSSCSGFSASAVPLVLGRNTPGQWGANSADGLPAGLSQADMHCDGADWTMTLTFVPAGCSGMSPDQIIEAGGTCDPFTATFVYALDAGCCPPSGGDLTITVTE